MMDLNDNPASALCAPLRLQDTDSDKPTVTPSYSSDFRQNCSRPHIQKEKKELTIRLLQLIHNKSARLFWHCSWSVRPTLLTHSDQSMREQVTLGETWTRSKALIEAVELQRICSRLSAPLRESRKSPSSPWQGWPMGSSSSTALASSSPSYAS